MNDQERITDFLCSEKKMSANYDTFSSEAVNVKVKDAFMGLYNQSHQAQTQLFQMAQTKGWYSLEKAPAEKIDQAYTKYSNQKPN